MSKKLKNKNSDKSSDNLNFQINLDPDKLQTLAMKRVQSKTSLKFDEAKINPAYEHDDINYIENGVNNNLYMISNKRKGSKITPILESPVDEQIYVECLQIDIVNNINK